LCEFHKDEIIAYFLYKPWTGSLRIPFLFLIGAKGDAIIFTFGDFD